MGKPRCIDSKLPFHASSPFGQSAAAGNPGLSDDLLLMQPMVLIFLEEEEFTVTGQENMQLVAAVIALLSSTVLSTLPAPSQTSITNLGELNQLDTFWGLPEQESHC